MMERKRIEGGREKKEKRQFWRSNGPIARGWRHARVDEVEEATSRTFPELAFLMRRG
jgi:hypothetical protein